MPASLQKMKLTDAERRWLSELHRANFTDVDFKALRIKLRDELPIDFDIESLTEKKLVCDHHITLLGIWHIDKKSTIFQVVEKVIICARDYLFQNHSSKSLSAQEVAIRTNYDPEAVAIAFLLIFDLENFFSIASSTEESRGFTEVRFSNDERSLKKFLSFKSIKDELQTYHAQAVIRRQSRSRIKDNSSMESHAKEELNAFPSKQNLWKHIQMEFEISKQVFGKKMNFVTDRFKRDVIFRDIEHAFFLAKSGLPKPAVILAGGVIEELLRLYLQSKNLKPKRDTFEAYINACEANGLFKSGINLLSNSVRHFRNLVHLEREKGRRYTITKATAQGAISSIFVIVNDFDSNRT